MDQRYFVSLFILALLIFFAWAVAPDASEPGEIIPGTETGLVTKSEQTESPENFMTVTSQRAVPIIGLAGEPQVGAKVDAIAFSHQVKSDEQLNAIPDRSATDKTTVPILSAGFSRPSPERQAFDQNSTDKPSDGDVAEKPSLQPVQRFGMPNTQQPLSKLPNQRMVLKPIAKIQNPFSQQTISSSPADNAPVSDPLFESRPGSRVSDRSQTSSQLDLNHPRATLTSGSSGPNLQQPLGMTSGGARAPAGRAGAIRRDQYIWHVVGPAESLTSISVQYFGDDSQVAKIIAINEDLITDPQLLPVGEAIRIPSR